MSRVYIFLLMLTVSFASCTSSTNNNEATTEEKAVSNSEEEDTTNNGETTTEVGYKTVVITSDIPSPRKEMKASIGTQTLTVNYGSPSVKDRKVFSELKLYDKVWRTGANEATTFEISSKIKVQGKDLAAGKYGLFTIPKEDGNWTVIFNSVADQWGAYDYKKGKDVLRVNATAEILDETAETMDFVIENNHLVLKWDKTVLKIKLEL